MRNLPQQLPEDRRKAIAIAAAKVAASDTQWLGCVVDLGKTYRRANAPSAAAAVFRANLAEARGKVDFAEVIRGYWYEWGVCEGLAGETAEHRGADAWLQGLSISDHLNPAPITLEHCKISCAGLGVAFGKLARASPDCPFAKVRRAVAWLGRLTDPDPKTAGYFDRYDHHADKIHTPYPKDLSEAIAGSPPASGRWVARSRIRVSLPSPILINLASSTWQQRFQANHTGKAAVDFQRTKRHGRGHRARQSPTIVSVRRMESTRVDFPLVVKITSIRGQTDGDIDRRCT